MKFRCYNFIMILYTDNDRHINAINYIQSNYDNYVMILHDKDINEVGELKKEHYHVLLRFKNAKWNTSLSKELDIEDNLVQECKNITGSLKYFIHYNNSNKYQYDIENLIGSEKLIRKLKTIISNDTDENEKALNLIDYITSYEGFIKADIFGRYCCSIGMWDVFRRNSHYFLYLINEHNNNYKNSIS